MPTRAAVPGSSSWDFRCTRCSAASTPAPVSAVFRSANGPQLDGLETRNLDAVIRYYDAQTDDAQLTRAVVDSARTLGGELADARELSSARISRTTASS